MKNRVSKIRKVLEPENLHYVRSAENPADPASRGVLPEKFIACQLWFNGPHWLQTDELPTTPIKEQEVSACATLTTEREENFIERFSNWNTLLKVTARCLRWKTKAKGELSADEISMAAKRIILYQQRITFRKEIEQLLKSKAISKRNWIVPLSSFVDKEDGFLKAGGKIDKAEVPEDRKHPILLAKGHLADLYIRHVHLENGYSGNTLTERLVKEQFWIPSVGSRIQKYIRNCTACVRWKALTIHQKMGDLPRDRVVPAPLFSKVGVDLAGPFHIKASRIKFEKVIKVWFAVFICMVTKAIHL